MADTKLSALTEATSLDSSDEFYVNDSGTSKRITKGNLQTGADAKFVSGTAGTSTQLGQWNADGDLVGWTLSVDLTADVTGALPVANGGTGATTASGARTALGVDAAGTDNSTDVTLSGSYDYITIAGQVITVGQVDLSTDVTGTLPASSVGSIPVAYGIACSDETTDLTTGTAKATFRVPHAMTLTGVRASVTTAPVGSTIIVDINEGGTTILSTKLTIDASEKTSTTAATAAVISDSALADDAEITIDIDQVGSSTAGAGLKVWLIGTR